MKKIPKLKQDATPKIAGIIYQFYVAVEMGFNLIKGDKLLIEKYGDITISNNLQIEVKKHEAPLTDLHENLWKTLSNWMDDEFEPKHYKELILLTTENFGEQSTLKEWNNKTSSDKKEILESIASKYSEKESKSEKTVQLLESVLDNKKEEKLDLILGKFSILDSAPKPMDYYEVLKEKFGKGVLETNREDFINSILGFIICPESVSSSNYWEISEKDFSGKVHALTEQYSSGTKIFPQKRTTKELTAEEIKSKERHLFVTKIDDIEYGEVKNKAIEDYIRTKETILNELKEYSVPKSAYDSYEKNLIDTCEPMYRKASRNAKEENIISHSQDYYDNVMSLPVAGFRNFNDTPKYFRNGMLHNIADEKRDFRWKLNNKNDD